MDTNIAIWECIEKLDKNIEMLSPKDRQFGESLLFSAKTRGLSPKQEYWVRVLSERTEQVVPVKQDVGDISRIVEMLDTAAQHKKMVAMVVAPETGPTIRISVATEKSSRPGTITVRSEHVGPDGRIYYGRITRDGLFEPSRRTNPEVTNSVARALKEMARDPAASALRYSKETMRCCFCLRRLTDDRSRDKGYGPDCAAHYGLPY